jgi:hypothetical protein
MQAVRRGWGASGALGLGTQAVRSGVGTQAGPPGLAPDQPLDEPLALDRLHFHRPLHVVAFCLFDAHGDVTE